MLPSCGDGHKDPGEQCDGADLGGLTCVTLGYSQPGNLQCTVQCKLETGSCLAVCDGAKVEPGEACDGNFLNGHSCTDFGFTNPAGLTCLPDCSGVDPAGCHATCGNNVVEKGEVCDGNLLNGHSCVELGYVNPAGLKCTACAVDGSGCVAVCGNNKVEPGEQCDDGNTTSGDGCSSTCKSEVLGSTCGTAIPVTATLGAAQVLSGSTAGGGDHTGSTCTGSAAPDRVYAITVQSAGFLTVSLTRAQTNFDSVLYIGQGCAEGNPSTSLLCADSYDVVNNQPLNGGEVSSLRVAQGQKYFVFVDGFAAGDSGNYQLVVDLSTGTDCNDPVPIPLEPGAPMSLLGNNNNTFPTTAGSCGGTPGGQIVYRITRPDNGPIGVVTDTSATNYNSVLYARSTCNNGMTELACSNQAGTAQESIDLAATGGTPAFVFVDGSTGSPSGNYGLTLTP
jgi:cysteine-rich repeat protein